LCIDGGYEICAEMYNKNILAPLATFIPKVRFSGRFNTVLRAAAPEPTHGPGPANVRSFSFFYYLFLFLDFVDFGAIYRISKDGARERAEGRIRICRECHYHLVVSLVSFECCKRARVLGRRPSSPVRRPTQARSVAVPV
jgi:hypothetical protein